MKKVVYLIFALHEVLFLTAQSPDSVICRKLPTVSVRTTVLNFSFRNGFDVSQISLKNGFELTSSDSSYKVVAFRVSYVGEDSDVYFRDIYGNKVTVENFPILKSLKGGDFIEIVCINLQKDSKFYQSPSFYFRIEKQVLN
jgi:hypothetical protein